MSAQQLEILSGHLRGANFLYAPDGEGSDIRIPADVSDDSCQQVIAELEDISQSLAEVPHSEKGLKTQRVADFLGRRGLAMKPFVGVDETGQAAINEIIAYKPGSTKTIGSRVQLLDFIYVMRRTLETQVESESIEACLVHEQFHGNQPYWDILVFRLADGSIGYRPLRNGFSSYDHSQPPGDVFEEGMASLLSHEYMTHALGLTHGFLDRTEPQKIDTTDEEGRAAAYLLPGSYLYEDPGTGVTTWSVSAHAAYGMQLLIAQDPAIYPAMLTARKNRNSGDEFVDRVNAIEPGLHDRLSQYPYKPAEFAKATSFIIGKLYDGDAEKALEAASEQDSCELIAA